jgi:hypothetical protein
MEPNFEVVECCPHCGGENVWENLDAVKCGYVATCQYCGKKIFLCDECYHADDNPYMKCDWHPIFVNGKEVGGECFRGIIFPEDSYDA